MYLPLQSQFTLGHFHTVQGLDHQRYHHKPIIVDRLHFLHLEHPLEPLVDPCELSELHSIIGEVGDLEEILQVGNGHLATCHKTCFSPLKLIFKFAHCNVHIFLGHIQIQLIDWLLFLQALVVTQKHDLEERRPELILIPREILINHSSCFKSFSIVLTKLFRILLAEIDQNGIALCQLEPIIDNERNLPQNIHQQVLLCSSLIFAHIHNMRDVLDLAKVEQAFY